METALLADRQSLDDLFSITYEELRRLARAVLRSDSRARLTPTTLVNEAWLKLSRSPEVADKSPLHFRRIAGRAMRQILVDAARRRCSQIRGGGQLSVTFDESLGIMSHDNGSKEILALDAALDTLNRISPRQAALVEGRFFGGLNCLEIAATLGVSEATVMRDWRVARAWLAREVRKGVLVPATAGSSPY